MSNANEIDINGAISIDEALKIEFKELKSMIILVEGKTFEYLHEGEAVTDFARRVIKRILMALGNVSSDKYDEYCSGSDDEYKDNETARRIRNIRSRWERYIINTRTGRSKNAYSVIRPLLRLMFLEYHTDKDLENAKKLLGVKNRPVDYMNGYPNDINSWKIRYNSGEDAIFLPVPEYYEIHTEMSGEEKIEDIPDENSVEYTVREAIKASQKKKQVIFTGAPGTGKTYSVEEYVNKMLTVSDDNGEPVVDESRKEFVQFHSSFDYTDFVEGLRPVRKKKKGDMQFVRMDGIFKAFCRKAVEAYNAALAEFEANYNTARETVDQLRKEIGENSGEKIGENSVSEEVQRQLDEANTALESADKAFKEAKVQLLDKPYYFIIDEINRADLGRVFGELMYCFEKRGKEHRVKTQYSNLPTCNERGVPIKKDHDVFADGFYIPENIIVLGTMNDIDRSVETFDFALRRRFDWSEISADKVMESSLKSMKENGDITGEITPGLVNRIKEMNGVVEHEPGLGKEFMIGPAYFKDYNGTEESLKTIWNRNIEPILREYMRGRQTTEIKTFIEDTENKLLHPIDKDSDKSRNNRNGTSDNSEQGGADAPDPDPSADESAVGSTAQEGE